MSHSREPIGFAPPPIDEDTIMAVERVLRSGWITSGPELVAFESEVSDFLGVQWTCCLSSWTSACELTLRWFGIGPGDEVLIPAMTYAATANIVLHCGAKPVMVDVALDDRVASLEALQSAFSSRTKVVMPVDLGGWPVDYQGIADWLSSSEVRSVFQPTSQNQRELGRPLFLSDAAHSFGAIYRGEAVGNHADVTGFSFHAVKNLTTAEGGALAFNLPSQFKLADLQQWFKAMSLHGQTRNAHEKTVSGRWQYDVEEAGFKCNMTDIQAAIGRVQLAKYPAQLKRRRAVAERYDAGFQGQDWYASPPLHNSERTSSFHLFQMRIIGFKSEQRDAVMHALKERGIATNVHFIPLPLLSLHKDRGERLDRYPTTERLFNETLSLPIHLQLSDEDVDWIIAEVILAIESHL